MGTKRLLKLFVFQTQMVKNILQNVELFPQHIADVFVLVLTCFNSTPVVAHH